MTTLIIIFSLLGGWFARIDGGGWPRMPEWIERTLCMSPFVLACHDFAGWYGLIAYLGVLGLALGHGQYFLARLKEYVSPEKVDFIVKKLFGPDPRSDNKLSGYQIAVNMIEYGHTKLYWRCVFGMFVGGTLVGLPATLLAVYFDQSLLIISSFAATGVVKAVAYITGYELFRNTESAEFINGTLRTMLAILTLGV